LFVHVYAGTHQTDVYFHFGIISMAVLIFLL